MQGPPAQVDVGVVVHLLGDVGDRTIAATASRKLGQLDGAADAVAVPGPERAARGGRRTSSSAVRRCGRGMRPSCRRSAQVWMPHSVLVLAGPAAGAGVLAGCDRAGARRAPDRAVAELDQRVDRHLVLGDVGVDVVLRPGGERVDLDHRRAWRPSRPAACPRGWATRPAGCPSPRPRSRPAPAPAACTLRSAQHRSGSRSCSRGPNSASCSATVCCGVTLTSVIGSALVIQSRVPMRLGEVVAGVEEDARARRGRRGSRGGRAGRRPWTT